MAVSGMIITVMGGGPRKRLIQSVSRAMISPRVIMSQVESGCWSGEVGSADVGVVDVNGGVVLLAPRKYLLRKDILRVLQ